MAKTEDQSVREQWWRTTTHSFLPNRKGLWNNGEGKKSSKSWNGPWRTQKPLTKKNTAAPPTLSIASQTHTERRFTLFMGHLRRRCSGNASIVAGDVLINLLYKTGIKWCRALSKQTRQTRKQCKKQSWEKTCKFLKLKFKTPVPPKGLNHILPTTYVKSHTNKIRRFWSIQKYTSVF